MPGLPGDVHNYDSLVTCTVPNSRHGRGPGVSLAELGSLSVFVDHVCEESMTPVGASRTMVGISSGAGVRDDRVGVILVCLSEPGAGAKQEP